MFYATKCSKHRQEAGPHRLSGMCMRGGGWAVCVIPVLLREARNQDYQGGRAGSTQAKATAGVSFKQATPPSKTFGGRVLIGAGTAVFRFQGSPQSHWPKLSGLPTSAPPPRPKRNTANHALYQQQHQVRISKRIKETGRATATASASAHRW